MSIDMGRPRLTLRQIEVIRAIMVSGSVSGAARFLNVAQPGVSRTLKHLEGLLGISLFERRSGRLVPAEDAKDIFGQVQQVFAKLENLQQSVDQYRRGRDVELSIGSVPSIAQVMVPRAVARLVALFPDLRINVELLKIEEAIDFLMLRRGDLVCMSSRFDHPTIDFLPLATGQLLCLAERSHPIACLPSVSAEQIASHPLIGIDPSDPYGAIMAGAFDRLSLTYDMAIRARFGSTVIGLVKQRLGVAVIDSFTLEDIADDHPQLVAVPISDDTRFETFVAVRNDLELSGFSKRFVALLRAEMTASSARHIS